MRHLMLDRVPGVVGDVLSLSFFLFRRDECCYRVSLFQVVEFSFPFLYFLCLTNMKL